MSFFFTYLSVANPKTVKNATDMTKIQIKSENLTPFGGIFPGMEQFDSGLSSVIDSTLGLRCKFYGYQYSEIIRSLMSVYFCGGSCIEDVTTHLMKHLSLHPTLRTCSADTILRAIKELTRDNISHTSDTGKVYDFNTADTLNTLLLNCLLATGQLKAGGEYDVDFDHQFLETEKYDAKPTYKKFLGYRPGVAVIGDMIVGIENSDGNTNVRFHQQDTLRRIFERLERNNIAVNRFRADCGSCSEEIVEQVEKHCKSFYIRANRCSSLYEDILALRGWKTEEIDRLVKKRMIEKYRRDHNKPWFKHAGKPIAKGTFSQWTDISTPRLASVVENLFGESLMLHRDHLLGDTLRARPVIIHYRSPFNYVVEALVVLLFAAGVWCGRRQRFLWLALSFFGFDLLLHVILGFGINEVYIMSAHWLFCFTIAIAYVFRRWQHTRLHTPLRLFATTLTLFLMAWNWWLLVDYLY